MCVCEREREREREMCMNGCVCVCVFRNVQTGKGATSAPWRSATQSPAISSIPCEWTEAKAQVPSSWGPRTAKACGRQRRQLTPLKLSRPKNKKQPNKERVGRMGGLEASEVLRARLSEQDRRSANEDLVFGNIRNL